MATGAALVFAGKSVATPAISFIVTKAFSYLNEWRQAEGMEAVKHRLMALLEKVQTVHEAVDHQQIKEQSNALDAWLWRFRDAIEEAEDAIDEIDYYRLEGEARARNIEDEVRNPISKFFRGKVIDKVAEYISESSALKRLRNAVVKLEEVATDVGTFLQLLNVPRCLPENAAESSDHQTSSTLAATEIIGRNKEKKQVVGWLLKSEELNKNSEKSNKNSVVPVFAIIGIGGIGKTTLAQIVCKELTEYKCFDCVVWAHVSSNAFNATKITKKILEAVTQEKHDLSTLEAMQTTLKEKLDPKKFLLILDDVWEDSNRDEWEILLAPFKTSQRGGRILLTTRMGSVADMVTSVMRVQKEYLSLDGLGDDDNFMLFKKYAFDGMKGEEYKHLLKTAEKIVKKFRGCPLVTKIAGGHLRSNVSDEHWDNLREELEHVEGSMDVIVTTVLRSSYRHLPAHLQLCFRYCSIFPQAYRFNKEELVKMWMGSGLIEQSTSQKKRPEVIGGEYLGQLANKSFFTFVPTGNPGSKYYAGYYIMHDLLHELARNVSSGECLRLESADYRVQMCTVRHLWIANLSKLTIEDINAMSHRQNNLRTLVIEDSHDFSDGNHVAALEKVVETSKGLRLLSLKNVAKFCFAKQVANKHLRYVSLYGMHNIYGFSKLYHLQVLIVSKSSPYTDPKQLRNVRNLSCLRYVSYGSNGIGEFVVSGLTSLQELHNFQIQSKEGYRISALGNLSSLCKLQVCSLEYVGSHAEAMAAKLNEKQHLRSLSLSWAQTYGIPKEEDDLIFDALEPHTCLENLEISGYSGARFPTWISSNLPLANLVSLELRRCINWEHLPALGKLELLKHLELESLTELKQIGQPFDKSGDDCSDHLCLPQNLKTLVVEGCKKLRKLPLLPPSLMRLEINGVGLAILPRIICEQYSKPSKLLSVLIRDCPDLTSLEGSFLLQEEYMRTLQVLNIVDCKNLKRAPLLFGAMNALTEFHIGSCYSLRMTEAEGGLLPLSLNELSLRQCGDLQLPLLKSLLGLTNLTSLRLCTCSRVKSLPSADVFRTLRLLREMIVTRCDYLSSLGGLGALSYLTWLEITECPKLKEAAELDEVVDSSLQVYSLWVHIPRMLYVEPLKRLCNTKSLIISVGNGSIPKPWLEQNHESLQSLEILKPDMVESLEEFRSLERLEFDCVPTRLSLPELPPSLQRFIVRRCDPVVERRWSNTNRQGSEWKRISRIPYVKIGNNYYKFGSPRFW